jgi:hypothetical protein
MTTRSRSELTTASRVWRGAPLDSVAGPIPSAGIAEEVALREIPEDQVRRAQLSDGLRQQFEITLPARVERHLQASHHPIVSDSTFAAASAECVDLFRDGHFYGCISLCQAVGEALVRHMCVCDFDRAAGAFEKNVRALRKRGRINA